MDLTVSRLHSIERIVGRSLPRTAPTDLRATFLKIFSRIHPGDFPLGQAYFARKDGGRGRANRRVRGRGPGARFA